MDTPCYYHVEGQAHQQRRRHLIGVSLFAAFLTLLAMFAISSPIANALYTAPTTTTTTTTTTPRMFGIEAPVPAHQTPAARPQWVAPADPRNPLDMPRPAAPFEYGVPQEPTPEAGGQSLDFGLLAACAAVIAACTSPLWRRPRSVAMYTTTGERAPNDVEADTELATLSAAKKWQAVLAEIEEMDRAAAEAAEKAAAEEGTMSAKLKSVAVFSLPLAASAFILQVLPVGGVVSPPPPSPHYHPQKISSDEPPPPPLPVRQARLELSGGSTPDQLRPLPVHKHTAIMLCSLVSSHVTQRMSTSPFSLQQENRKPYN